MVFENAPDKDCEADFAPGALDADTLDGIDGIARIADAGRVDDVERYALDLDGFADLVARGAGNRRHDRHIGARQRVQQ